MSMFSGTLDKTTFSNWMYVKKRVRGSLSGGTHLSVLFSNVFLIFLTLSIKLSQNILPVIFLECKDRNLGPA